jgi:diguanylate cyclase (GGDEF)-like protein
VERAFVAFLKNALDRYARTASVDAPTRLKLKTIAQRLDVLARSMSVRQPAPEWRDAAALEQHLIALMWAARNPATRPQPPTAAEASEDRLQPLQRTLEGQLDKAIFTNLDSIASLGSIEQTLRGVQPGELEEWREILRDSAREIIENYRALGENLQQARATLADIHRSFRATAHVSAAALGLDRDFLLERLNAEMRRAQRYRHPLSLALLGPDHIDDIRHLIGAEAAREVLRYYQQNLSSCARAYDIVTSCKPHRLVWLLPGANTDQGVSALRKAQERITAAHYHYAGRLRRLPTFSAAVVGYGPGDDSAHLLARAETLAAHAKRAGPSHIEWEQRRAATPPARVV